MEWFLIIVVILCVIALIVLAVMRRKAKTEEESSGSREASTSEKESVAIKPITKKEIKKNGPAQITIYASQGRIGVKNCPYCDAENRTGVPLCSVCGERLN